MRHNVTSLRARDLDVTHVEQVRSYLLGTEVETQVERSSGVLFGSHEEETAARWEGPNI